MQIGPHLDSNELPPDRKRPPLSTCAGQLSVAPNEQLVLIPSICRSWLHSSRRKNIRPAIMRTFSWIWRSRAARRNGRLSKVSPAGTNTTSASSAKRADFPASSRLMAGRNLSASNWSSVINELASRVGGASDKNHVVRRTAILDRGVETRPTIAIAATKTPTGRWQWHRRSMELDTRRMSRLRRLYLKGMAICLIHQSEGLNDAAFRGGTRGNIRAKHNR